MRCPKCGQENQDDVKECFLCNCLLIDEKESKSSEPVTVQVSILALIAIILAVYGLVFTIPSLIILRTPRRTNIVPDEILMILYFIGLFSLGGAITLGLISFIKIEISGGRKTGLNFAIGAILIPVFTFIFLIWSILLPRTRSVAFRMVCGTNLSVLGMSMNMYANDFDDKLPKAGGKNSTWGTSIKWDAPNRYDAYRVNSDGTGGTVTISSSLYLSFKYTGEAIPKYFICPGDLKVSEFKPSGTNKTFSYYAKLWDFGPEPWKHVSYAYHMPYGSYALTTSSEPGMAVAADRNPWIPSLGWEVKDFSLFDPDGDKSVTKNGNSPCHQDEGQNVLYLDSHVDFQSVSFCGINEDNIYTIWDGTDIRRGRIPKFGDQPVDRLDSLLVNDPSGKKQ